MVTTDDIENLELESHLFEMKVVSKVGQYVLQMCFLCSSSCYVSK